MNRSHWIHSVVAWLAAACLWLATTSGSAAQQPPFPPTDFPDPSRWGKNIQRTLRLLATSTAERRNTVRILFYGQSITEQGWTKLVEQDLRQRFPHAHLIIENRALGGFGSQMLVKTAESWIKTFEVGRDVQWSDGKLRLSFEGSRIDLICQPGEGTASAISVDGRKPSEWPQLYKFTRALARPAGEWVVRWPVVAPI